MKLDKDKMVVGRFVIANGRISDIMLWGSYFPGISGPEIVVGSYFLSMEIPEEDDPLEPPAL